MEENTTDFGGELKSLAEIADLIEKNNLLKDEDIQIKISLEKPKYNKILRQPALPMLQTIAANLPKPSVQPVTSV